MNKEFIEENKNLENINIYDNKKEINVDNLNDILKSILITSTFLKTENIKNIKFLPSKQNYTIEVSNDNRKLYMIISEFGYVENVRENSIDGKIIYTPDDVYVSNEENNSNVKEICYDFIPYKKIGDILLDKSKEQKVNSSNTPWLSENSLNNVLCWVAVIDHPDHVKRQNGDIEHLYIICENKKIEITCLYEKFIDNLNQLSGDITIVEDNSDIEQSTKFIYSTKLGIIADAILSKNDGQYYIRSINFTGKEVFNRIIRNMLCEIVPIELKVASKAISTSNQKPWLEYIEIDEESGKRKLRNDTPKEIETQYKSFLNNNMVNYNEFVGDNNTYLINIKKDNYIFIKASATFSIEKINNCFISLEDGKVYNYKYNSNNLNKYQYYKDLTNEQKNRLLTYIEDNNLLNINIDNRTINVSNSIEICINGKKNNIINASKELTNNEKHIFDDIADMVFNDGNNTLEKIKTFFSMDSSNDKEIIKFAQDHGYKGVKYNGKWKDYKVYEPYMDENELSYTGLPLAILVNNQGEIRMSTSDEAMAIIDDDSYMKSFKENRINELEIEKNLEEVSKYSILNKTLEELLSAKKRFISDWNLLLFNTINDRWIMNSATYRVHIVSIIEAILRRTDDNISRQQLELLNMITNNKYFSNQDRESVIKIVKQLKELE